jgi:hypothetical protein
MADEPLLVTVPVLSLLPVELVVPFPVDVEVPVVLLAAVDVPSPTVRKPVTASAATPVPAVTASTLR